MAKPGNDLLEEKYKTQRLEEARHRYVDNRHLVQRALGACSYIFGQRTYCLVTGLVWCGEADVCCVLLGLTGERMWGGLSRRPFSWVHSGWFTQGWVPVSVQNGMATSAHPVCLQCPAPCLQPSVPVQLPSCSCSDCGSLDCSSLVLSLECNSESEMLRWEGLWHQRPSLSTS